MTDFRALGLSDRLLSTLDAAGFTEPTPIQAKAIPAILDGRDVMGLAQTGTGKTAAFGLPLLNRALVPQGKLADREVRALILAPTRELARQITGNLQMLAGKSHLRIRTVVGGASINGQCRQLERGADILVATPGRLIDLTERRAVRLDTVTFLVLDEADQMLDMGFIQPLRRIAKMLGPERQTVLFSATMPKQIAELSQAFQNDPLRIEVARPGRPAEKISQSVHFVEQAAKMDLLKSHLDTHRGELALVFARTKHGAERMMKQLCAAGFEAVSIHGNKSQGQRERALKAFRDAKAMVLVATDVAARGIDIPDVRHVYNFDLPNVPENYIHRIGRTARAGADGAAIAYCAPQEMGELRAIEKVLKTTIAVAGGEPWREAAAKPAKGGGRGKPGGQRRNRRPGNRGRQVKRAA
ncbi:MAG: DEAD/DEAH box helicase [Rubricella sp.]